VITPVIKQKKDWDCGVAALAMLLALEYKDVAKEVIDDPKLTSRGLILRQVEELIVHFGFTPKRIYKKKDYLDGATGILGMNGGTMSSAGHWVVIKDGVIIDPDDGTVSTPEEYIEANKCRPATIVAIE
jgi:hypothetical protein